MAPVTTLRRSKRSVLIAGHQTSISLEPMFWRALEAAARERGRPLNRLVAEIDAERLDATARPTLPRRSASGYSTALGG